MQNLILVSSIFVSGKDHFRVEVFGCDSTIHTHDFDKSKNDLIFNTEAAMIKAKTGGPLLFRSPLDSTIISI